MTGSIDFASLLLVALAAGCSPQFVPTAPSVSASQGAVYTSADLEDYLARWPKRDGLTAVELSDYLCRFLLNNPPLFLQILANYPVVFEEWIVEMENLSFVDRGDCVDRECMRLKMIGALQRTKCGERDRAMCDRLLARLGTIAVRKIQ